MAKVEVGGVPPGYASAPPPGYGAPPPGYGGAPTPGYGVAPPPGYAGAPPPGYGPPGYAGAPPPGYGPPPGAPGGTPLAPMGMPAAPAAQRFDVPGAPAMPVALDPSQVAQIEHLTRLSKLFVQQKIDWIEMFTGFDVSNTYEVFLSKEHKAAGSRWLLAKEDSSACARLCIPRQRAFTLDVGVAHASGGGGRTMEEQLGLVDSAFVYPMVRLRRECFWCLSEVAVQDGRGNPIGSGEEICTNLFLQLPLTCCPVGWDLRIGERAYQLRGPCGATLQVCMQWPCRDPFDFVLNETGSGRTVGKVSNVPNGCCKMMFTNADDYEVEFDPSATPQERGLLLAMAFAIDARLFEAKQDKNDHNTNVMLG